jgi:hypothetical protein
MLTSLKRIVLATMLMLGAICGPVAHAQSADDAAKAAEKAESDRVFSELKRIGELKKQGKTALAAVQTRDLCLESHNPRLKTNFACYVIRNEYRDTALYEDVISELCIKGSADDCMAMFFLLRKQEPETSKEMQAGALSLACKYEDASACGLLGFSFLSGDIVPADRAKSKAMFQTGCDMLNAEVCADYADLLGKYKFGLADKEELFAVAQRACPTEEKRAERDFRSVKTCMTAAEAIAAKVETRTEVATFLEILNIACTSYRSAEACYWLAEDLENGDSGAVNKELARKALDLACRIERDDEVCPE